MMSRRSHVDSLPQRKIALDDICRAFGKACLAGLFLSGSLSQARDIAQQPFADNSIWNTPLGTGAQFAPLDSALAKVFHSDNYGYKSGSYSWIQNDALNVYQVKPSDPIMTWTVKSKSGSLPWKSKGNTVSFRTPKGMAFPKYDGEVVIISPDKSHAFETWLGSCDDFTLRCTANYIVKTDLLGSGISAVDGQSVGVRAFGGSVLGGYLRCSELDAGSIPHAIAMLLSQTQQKKSSVKAQQRVWPASTVDANSLSNYQGLIPLGTLVGIPPSVDINKIGLVTREGLMLAKAYQTYGGYNTDTATNTMVIAVIEPQCPAHRSALEKDKVRLIQYLSPVMNNSKDAVGGPGARVKN